MSIKLYVEFVAKPGKGDDLAKIFAAVSPQVRAGDAGCEGYELYRSTESPEKFYMIESWASAADLEAHGKSPAMAGLAGMRDLLAGAPVMNRYES